MSLPQAITPNRQQGFVLITLVALLVMGALAFLVSNLSPEFMQAYRQRQTDAALAQAREALIGYALQYRDAQAAKDLNATGNDDQTMYGYLPLPDLGSSRNQNIDPNCKDASNNPLEGCDANTFTGMTFDVKGIGPTVVGRFPWRTLGTGPLRDSNGECLWLIVSSLHSRIQRSSPPPVLPLMNWDTLGQLDIVVANGTAALQSALASAHDRPIAIILSPGPPLAGQDRSKNPSSTDDVTECGGNYDAKNYLDPANATALGGVTNYLAGSNNASGATGDSDPSNDPDIPKALSIQGVVQRQSDGKLWPGSCPVGASCGIAANDKGLALTADALFGAIRKNRYFRDDINSMLDGMEHDMNDYIAAGNNVTLDPISSFSTAWDDKLVGRIPDSPIIPPKYGNDVSPQGYFNHYRNQIFMAMAKPGYTFTVNGIPNCAGVLLFSNQRGPGQLRTTTAEIDTPGNYLEGDNLSHFSGVGLDFTGARLLDSVSEQTIQQDIVRCISGMATLAPVESPNLSSAQQLVAYDAASHTLTLGKEGVDTTVAAATDLFGCAWMTENRLLGGGLRTYFTFSFATVGTSVGSTGFVFAIIDAESNPSLPCGAAGSHLGYSGDNGTTPKIKFPKIGIEFDQSRNSGFPGSSGENSTDAGRNDPCGTSSCGANPITGYNSHAAIVYWGHEIANASDGVTRPDNDDNVHSFPTAESLSSTRRPPKNPDTSLGINLVNLRTAGRIFHVRIEVTPTRSTYINAAENSKTSMQTRVWILADSATATNQIAAMKNTTRPMAQLYPGFTETLSDTATVFDVAAGAVCSTVPPVAACPTHQTCGSDNVCYRQGLRNIKLGFTGSQRTQAQNVTIDNIFTTWLP